MKTSTVFKASLIVCLMSFFLAASAFGESPEFLQGVDQYKNENFEEAAEALKKARAQEPQSTVAAFFLGLTYKQMQNFPMAVENFRDAVTMTPRIKEALVELVEVLSRMGKPENLKEAKEWLAVAEKENIFPAKIAFLRGLILSKEGRDLEAVTQFEKAKALDESFTQSAEFQIAMSYVKAKQLDKARDRFKAAVLFDPQSDLASFARQYQDSVEKRLGQQVRFTLGVFGAYDDNQVSRWNGAGGPGAPAWTGEEDEETSRLRTQFRVDYVPILPGAWLFNAQYALSAAWNQNYSSSRDNLSNGLYLAPGYNFGQYAVNLAVNYNFSMKKEAAVNGYRKQSEYLSVGPLVRGLFMNQHLLEVFAGFDNKEFFDPAADSRNDRDSKTFRSYLSWIWSYTQGAFLNLKYEYTKEDSDGEWWENQGHKLIFNTSYPLMPRVAAQASCQYFIQDFENKSLDPIPSDPTKINDRLDKITNGSLGLTWEFMPGTMLIGQYAFTRADSNIAIYDYNQNVYSVGVEYRF
ncbi:MAG: tetratricopeptide repeat protein [Desulfobacterales bacterium]|nr:tetratricopeptide repeat protein [Desulfobacterales bacterium]